MFLFNFEFVFQIQTFCITTNEPILSHNKVRNSAAYVLHWQRFFCRSFHFSGEPMLMKFIIIQMMYCLFMVTFLLENRLSLQVFSYSFSIFKTPKLFQLELTIQTPSFQTEPRSANAISPTLPCSKSMSNELH